MLRTLLTGDDIAELLSKGNPLLEIGDGLEYKGKSKVGDTESTSFAWGNISSSDLNAGKDWFKRLSGTSPSWSVMLGLWNVKSCGLMRFWIGIRDKVGKLLTEGGS